MNIGRDDICVITTARTSQIELQEGSVRSAFADKLELFRLDELSGAEEQCVIAFMDRYALWGTRQTLDDEQKRRFVRQDCSGELRFVILAALNSPTIRDRIKQIIDVKGPPQTRDRVRAVLVLSQLLNLAQVRPDLSLISELLQFDARTAIQDHAAALRDFSLIRNGLITIRSTIFAEYVIQQLVETAFVIDAMTGVMRQLDVLHDNDEQYEYIFKNFARFRFVESAIAQEKRLVHMIKYFEDIKDLAHSRQNPLFWLQYAMCRLSLSQFKEAERLFEVAYALSKKAGYKENRHLNNQFARFLLESRTNSNEYTDFMSAFNRAHGICVKQMADEPSAHNPYNVAQGYRSFLERRSAELKDGDLVAIMRSCAEILRFCSARSSLNERPQAVSHCAAAMRATSTLARDTLSSRGVVM